MKINLKWSRKGINCMAEKIRTDGECAELPALACLDMVVMLQAEVKLLNDRLAGEVESWRLSDQIGTKRAQKAESEVERLQAALTKAQSGDHDYMQCVATIRSQRAEVERLREKLSGEQESGAALVTFNDGLLSLNRQHTQRLGEMARLSDIVCTWALEHKNIGEESPEVLEAASFLMEYADAVRPANHDFFSRESEAALAEAVRP